MLCCFYQVYWFQNQSRDIAINRQTLNGCMIIGKQNIASSLRRHFNILYSEIKTWLNWGLSKLTNGSYQGSAYGCVNVWRIVDEWVVFATLSLSLSCSFQSSLAAVHILPCQNSYKNGSFYKRVWVSVHILTSTCKPFQNTVSETQLIEPTAFLNVPYIF